MSFLTMDVSSLYSNIDHSIGINYVHKLLDEELEIPVPQRIFLLDSLRFMLENYFFMYHNALYHQCRGTAMGTRMAPSYANLFMWILKKTYITGDKEYKPRIILYKRFIDYLFFIWKGNERSALEFTKKLNSNSWGIKCTPKYNKDEIDFLDLVIKPENNQFMRSTFFNSIDANSYLSFQRNHFRKWKENIPFGQLRRIRKNCNSDDVFDKQATDVKNHLREKGYYENLISEAHKKSLKI